MIFPHNSFFIILRNSYPCTGSFCTGYGQKCCRCGDIDRSADRGRRCGCGVGRSGCKDCGVCESCGAQVPCNPPAPSDAPAPEEDICVRLNYAAQVFAAAVVSHCRDAGDSTPLQLCDAWSKTSYQRLQSHVTAAKTLSQVQHILVGAQQILLQGSALVVPPVSLISRFGSLTFEEQEAFISDHQLMCSLPSGDFFKALSATQAESTSTLARQLIAVHPPKDSESREVVNNFLDAVKRVSDCTDDLPLLGRSPQWGAVFSHCQGCGPECSQSHSHDGNCLVCDNSWHVGHSGHTCQRAPFSGRRGSWRSSSSGASVVPLHAEELSPGTVKVSLDPKSGQMEGAQSDAPLPHPDKEIGTVITLNITHSSSSTPQVIVGLTQIPPPLKAPIAPRVSVGLDLGGMKFIGKAEEAQDKLAANLKLAVSISPSVIK